MADTLLPLLMVIFVGLTVQPFNHLRAWHGYLIVAGFVLLVSRYIHWRITVTVLPASALDIQGVVVWLVFFAESLLLVETLLLSVVLSRRTNRSCEADIYEARLRALAPNDRPMVDVLIATYNEPLDVLEKTIAGALAIDWPQDRLNICVLDDGRRAWLWQYCEERGINHFTRSDNKHAKAGNINAALARTRAPYVLVLDADFVPQPNILTRAIGFFDREEIGIVQMPHNFFNSDPVQSNLNMRDCLPDEQRFFFDVIQPGRDGWNCAFCCGSNGIIRRAAIDEIGGRIPTDSITEDMLLTITLLRKGYITRYLDEPLAIGLAPENLDAYFLQRSRWAQGAIQIMFLENGPFGKGLSLMQRLLFVPSHWISQCICQPVAMIMPAFFLLTGIPPLINATTDQIVQFQLPVVVGGIVILRYFAHKHFFPISATVHSILQAIRILPTVALTLVRPWGHAFKVTPKGSDAGLVHEDRFIIKLSLGIILATCLGMILNANSEARIVENDALLPIVTFWAAVNMCLLLMVIAAAIPRPNFRAEERFLLSEPCRIHLPDAVLPGETVDISVTGISAVTNAANCEADFNVADWIGIELPLLGVIPAQIARVTAEENGVRHLGLVLSVQNSRVRDSLIQKIYTSGLKNVFSGGARRETTWRIFQSIFSYNQQIHVPKPAQVNLGSATETPHWLRDTANLVALTDAHSGWVESEVISEDTAATRKLSS